MKTDEVWLDTLPSDKSDEQLLAESYALDAAYAEAAAFDEKMQAEAYEKDLRAVVQALWDMVDCFDLSDSPEHNDYATWVGAKTAIERFEPWLDGAEEDDPRTMGWVDDRGRP